MADDRVERVARAINGAGLMCDYCSPDKEGKLPPDCCAYEAARAAIAAADGPNSAEVREQMLRANYGSDYRIYERYGSNRPRAQWDVT